MGKCTLHFFSICGMKNISYINSQKGIFVIHYYVGVSSIWAVDGWDGLTAHFDVCLVQSSNHNTSTRLIGAARAKDAWLILFWFLRQFYVIKRQIAAESTFFKFFSIIWKPSQAFYAVAAKVALWIIENKMIFKIM